MENTEIYFWKSKFEISKVHTVGGIHENTAYRSVTWKK